MATNNYTILNDIWMKGTNDFQQRVPQPTQQNISQVIDALLEPMNQMYYNQFMDALVMRIGTTYVHQQAFKNPLREFKKGQMLYGSTIQEIVPKWIRAHSYIDDAEDVFKMARPDMAHWYHSQNRRDRYDITVNDTELRTAFTEDTGLNKLVSAIMRVPINADEYDEYRIMMQLIAIYEQKWGFYKHALSAAPTNESTGKEFLQALRTYAGLLRFPSTTYNNGALTDVPIFVNPDELILLVTPQTQAAIDVQTLSGIFQLDKAEVKYRTILVDQFPLPNNDCVALLTTRDFFMCCDTVYRNTSEYNPKTLGTNYFLHHWGVYSVSPFVPAIMFTAGGSTTSTTVIEQEVTGMTISANSEYVAAGDTLALRVALTGSLSTNVPYMTVAPNAATYEVVVNRPDVGAINSPRTYVDEYGILHVDKKLIQYDVITVRATSTYVNPSGETTEYTATGTYTVI